MNLKDKIRAYLHLIRIHGAFLEPMYIITGALILGARDFSSLFILFLIGVMFHIYVYVLNEYIDVEVDSKSPELQNKPLVSGAISKKNALIISITGCICVFVLATIFFPSPLPILCISLAVASYGIYDIFGNKKIPLFAEFIGSWPYFFLFLFGVATVTTHFTMVVYLVGSLFFFKAFYGYVAESELKDVDHDHLIGGKTLAISLGVHVEDGRLILTRRYMACVYTTIGICFVLIMLLFFQPEINRWYSNIMILVIMVGLGIAIAVPTYKLLHISVFDRSKIKKYYVLGDTASIVLFYIILMPLLGVEIALFMILIPSIWYPAFNIVLYGKPLQPGV